MNEWMLFLAISLFMNALLWIQMHNMRTDYSELVGENTRLWKHNNDNNLTILKLRGLLRESGNATIHRDRVSED
jgi:hypothetical protein